MPCFGEMNMILAAILMLKYQDFDLCHHLTALQQLCDLTSQGPWPCMLFFFWSMVVEFELGEWR